MPIILPTDKHTFSTRVTIVLIYLLLIVGGATMVYPFMITISSSLSSVYDYKRFSPVPRSLYDREDRFVRSLADYFRSDIPEEHFPARPSHWTTWVTTANDIDGVHKFASKYLAVEDNPEALKRYKVIAADFADFNLDYPVDDTFCNYDFRDLAGYLQDEYVELYYRKRPEMRDQLSGRAARAHALAELRLAWGIPYESLFDIELKDEIKYPMHQRSWNYPDTAKAQAFLKFKDAYRRLMFRPGAESRWWAYMKKQGVTENVPWPVRREHTEFWDHFKTFVGAESPMTRTYPFALKPHWWKYLNRNKTKTALVAWATENDERLQAFYQKHKDVLLPLRSDVKDKETDVTRARRVLESEQQVLEETRDQLKRAGDQATGDAEKLEADVAAAELRVTAASKALAKLEAELETLRETFVFTADSQFEMSHYCVLFETVEVERWQDIPFPRPADYGNELYDRTWEHFVRNYYPRRLMEIRMSPRVTTLYQDYVRSLARNSIETYNKTMDTDYTSFEEIVPEARGTGSTWQNFVVSLPMDDIILHSSEAAWQRYIIEKYGSLDQINTTYGWSLGRLEEAQLPLAEACTVTFFENEWLYYASGVTSNYRMVFEFLFLRGRAFLNTIILVSLTILATLTVNPLAAYALSRFRLRFTEQILLFLLATMAFPHAVRAIPGFLLMRDLHLLNSFAALVLPGVANGLSIFILKGFFDGLPRELYEAATIDGASEIQMFFMVTLPLTTPILAVNTLNAFVHAYKSWAWALIVCQDQDYWTLAVWLYQMNQVWAEYPWIIMAGFVIASIPTAIVFIACQKVILRGIVLPAMK